MKQTILVFATVCIVALVSSGCVSTQPMTKKIEDNASLVGKVENFQYYISKNVVLTQMEQTQYSGKIAVSGKLEATYNKNVVQITSSTMGALIKTESDSSGNTIYCIAFEDDDNKYLRFLQPANSMEGRMYLIYDYPQSQSVVESISKCKVIQLSRRIASMAI